MEARDVTILGLHYVEDLTYQEIADTLKITPSRVCQLLWRAVERLRAQLGAEMLKRRPHDARVLVVDDDDGVSPRDRDARSRARLRRVAPPTTRRRRSR